MKKLILMGLILFGSVNSYAIKVLEGSVDKHMNTLNLRWGYKGGCHQKHDFKVELLRCEGSAPMFCQVRLVDRGEPDACSAYIVTEESFPLSDLGLSGEQLLGGTILIIFNVNQFSDDLIESFHIDVPDFK